MLPNTPDRVPLHTDRFARIRSGLLAFRPAAPCQRSTKLRLPLQEQPSRLRTLRPSLSSFRRPHPSHQHGPKFPRTVTSGPCCPNRLSPN